MFKKLKELYQRYMRGARANRYPQPKPNMTFSEMFKLACQVSPKNDSICAQVECWRHTQRPSEIDFRWNLWSSQLSKHFYGRTAEECLRAYEDAYCMYIADKASSPDPQKQIELVDKVDKCEK